MPVSKHFNTSNVLVSPVRKYGIKIIGGNFNTSNVLVSQREGTVLAASEHDFNTSNVLVSHPGELYPRRHDRISIHQMCWFLLIIHAGGAASDVISIHQMCWFLLLTKAHALHLQNHFNTSNVLVSPSSRGTW